MDKANFLSLLQDKEKLKDCNSLIEKGINIILNFNKEELQDLTEEDKFRVNTWIKTFYDGNKNYTITLHKLLDTKNLKTNFINTELKSNLESQKSLDKKLYRYAFLLDNEKVVDYVKEKGATLIGKVGEESKLILSLKLENTEILTCKISSWIDYCPQLPVSDMIICDNHYFKDEKTYVTNANELIKALCRLPKEAPVNCIIITKQNEVDKSFSLEKIQNEIQQLIKNLTESKKSNVAIILTYDSHDRQVITNYFRINNGASFQLKERGIKKNVLTEIKTHANKNNEEISDDLIAEYKRIVENNKKTTYGNVVCRFFE